MLGSHRVFQNTLVPAEEREIDPAGQGGLDIRPLLPGPVLVVAGRHEDLVLLDGWTHSRAGRRRRRWCSSRRSRSLQETDHRVLGVHEPARAVVVRPGMPRPVVGHLGGALIGLGVAGRAVDRAGVQAVAALGVVGLPGLVGGLEQDVGVARVVAHDERDRLFAAGVVADQVREIQAGHSVGRHRPRGRHGPVAAVDEPGGRRVVRPVRVRGKQAGTAGVWRSAACWRPPCAPRSPGSSPRAGCRCGTSSPEC